MKDWFLRYFVPHQGNNHKPHLFRDHVVLFLMAFIVGTQFLVLTTSLLFHQTDYFLSAVLPGALVDLTNSERTKFVVPELKVNPLLAQAAEAKAKDMAQKGYFAHTGPDGTTPWQWILNTGYVFDRAGENLAVNFYGSEDVVKAWMNSPGHKKNIIDAGFTEVGIGVAEGMYEGRTVLFVAQMFGTPARVFAAAIPNPRIVVTTPPVSSRKKTLPTTPVFARTASNPKVSTTSPALPSSVQRVVLSETTDVPASSNSLRGELSGDRINPNTFFARIFLHPNIYLAYAFIVAALFVAFPLILSLIIELRRGHMRHILFGTALFATLLTLVWVNQSGIFSMTVIV